MALQEDVKIAISRSKEENEQFRRTIAEIDEAIRNNEACLERARERLAQLRGERSQ